MAEINKDPCDDFKNDIWLYLDKDLPDEKMIFWQGHIVNCANCRKLLSDNQGILNSYNKVPLDDLLDVSYQKMIDNATANKSGAPVKRSKSLVDVFGFYRLTFGGAVVAAALIFILITVFKDPEIQFNKSISKNFLDWDGKLVSNRIEQFEDRILSLQTDEWDIYIVRKDSKEDWNKTLHLIQKKIRKMKKEAASTTL
jgi:hypothetical protein